MDKHEFDDFFRKNHFIFENGKIRPAKDLLEFSEWFSKPGSRRVDLTEINDDVRVSTVFLGINHNFSFDEDNPPVLFETMVFGGEYSDRGWRYTSYGQAKRGHWEIVDCIKAGKPPQLSFGHRPSIELFFEMFEEEKKEPENDDDA